MNSSPKSFLKDVFELSGFALPSCRRTAYRLLLLTHRPWVCLVDSTRVQHDRKTLTRIVLAVTTKQPSAVNYVVYRALAWVTSWCGGRGEVATGHTLY